MSPTLLLRVYGLAIFLSAALLFAIQPMFTKMVLPRLGGTPGVWSVAMVFFQAVLLAGYAYAHLITRHIPGRGSLVVHLALMAVAMLSLPLAIAAGWGRPPAAQAELWLIALFAVSIGLPFFALSANGPLLQAWFARTGHPDAANPYFLYAASNVGSFLALLAYPFALEPLTRLGQQTRGWTVLFYVLIALIAVCGWMMLRAGKPPGEAVGDEPDPPPAWREVASFVALAAVPSALLVSVTAHISTDIAAAPFMWVVPLALYLVTFVIVFSTRPVLPHRWMVFVEPFFIAGLVAVMSLDVTSYTLGVLALNVAAFFVVTMVCHGELSRRRPAAQHLTAFYMWMSFGGVVGGVFAGLVAPKLFNWVAEYPVLIVLAILCRPGFRLPRDWRSGVTWLSALVIVAIAAAPAFGQQYIASETMFNWTIGIMLAIAIAVSAEPLPFAAVIAAVFLIGNLYKPEGERRESLRSFFGVHKIHETADGQYRVLLHGTTIHGAERLLDDDGNPITGRPELITYYNPNSPLAETVRAVRERAGRPIRVAVVGLGTGSMACHSQPGEPWTYYEIDPLVVRIARDPARFSFIAKCAPEIPVVMGDARLTLADSAERYDLIVLDAFSSDAIPIHLMTREAMATYRDRLAANGVVAMHVSNRHMELASVVAGIAHANGLVTRVNNRAAREDELESRYVFTSTVAISARDDGDFGLLTRSEDWQPRAPEAGQRIWTDDYSNVIGAIFRQYWPEPDP